MYVQLTVKAYMRKPLSCVSMRIHKHTQITNECVCVFPTHNYARSKQTSYRIMTVEMYVTLDKAKFNTANTRQLMLVAVTWPGCRCSNCRHIWTISTKIGVNRQISHSPPQSNLTGIRPMQAVLIYAASRTDSLDEGSRPLSLFVRTCLKTLYTRKVMAVGTCRLAAIIFQSYVIIRSLR